MLIQRNRITALAFRALLLSGCFTAACAVGENAVVGPAAAGGSNVGSGGSGTSGAAHGGSIGTAGTGVSGATDTGGKSAAGDAGSAGDSGGSTISDNGGGGATGGAGKGGATADGGKGGNATAGGGSGGSATAGGGSGGSATAGGGNGGGAGATGGTAGSGGATVAPIDLSTFQPASAGTYNTTSHTLTIVGQLYFQFPLPKTFNAGQSVAVHVVGTNQGTSGLRSWLVDSSQTTLSNSVTTYVGAGLPSGAFTLDYTLTATNPAGFLYFKGATFNTNIDNVTIASITVTY